MFLWVGADGHIDRRGDVFGDLPRALTECVVDAVKTIVVAPSPEKQRHILLGVYLGTGS